MNLLVFNGVDGVGSLILFPALVVPQVGVLDFILFFRGPTPLALQGAVQRILETHQNTMGIIFMYPLVN